MRLRKLLVSLTVLGLVCGVTMSVFAGPSAQDELDSLKKQVASLNEKIQKMEEQAQTTPTTDPTLEKRVRDLEARMTERAADQAAFTAGWKDGFKLQSSDGQHMLHIGGYLQADGIWEAGDPGFRDESNDGFTAKRIRLIACGYMYTYFSFYFEYAFDRGSAGLRDAYMDITYFDPFNIRIGLMKPPISHEDLQDSSNMIFIERSLMNNLVPDRDIGVMFHGNIKKVVEYQVGVLDGNNFAGSNQDDELAYMVRVMVTPLGQSDNKWFNKLAFGGHFSWGNAHNSNFRQDYVTTSGLTIFHWNDGAILDGQVTRYGAELMWYAGPVSLNAEWMRLEQKIADPGAGLGPKEFQAEGWYIEVGYVLTGEDASYTGVVPKNNFDPRNGKWGAFQLALRYSNLNVEDEALHEGYAQGSDDTDAYAVSLNWYLNPAVRLMLMYEHVALNKSNDYDGYRNARDEDAIMFRAQLKF